MEAETSYQRTPAGPTSSTSKCEAGQRFGLLTVIGGETAFTTRNGTESKGILVRCDCGQDRVVPLADLKRGATRSCGCLKLGKRQPALGDTYGLWTVISDQVSGSRVKVPCRCVCGTVRNVARESLVSGKSSSCGCISLRQRREIQHGDTFGLWTVLRYVGRRRVGVRNRPIFECECFCGTIRDVLKSALLSGSSASCGCAAGTGRLRQMHGLSRDGESKSCLYGIWSKLQASGLNSVCWDCNYAAFFDWATSTRYREGMILARANPKQAYSPSNCSWAEPIGGGPRTGRKARDHAHRYLKNRRRSLTTLATTLSAGLIFVLAHEIISSKPDRAKDPRVVEYLQRLKPVERELEDVRENLYEISRGRAVEESIDHIEYDANRETSELASIRSVPAELTGAHGKFLAWARTLQGSVKLAKQKQSEGTRRRLADSVGKADSIYERIEIKAPPDER
jgi:hypothetical protein